MNNTVITLAGTIGAGKTTWGKLIADHFGTQLFEEEVNNNPFLAKYYENPIYAFHLQVFFLNHRFKAIKQALTNPNHVLDRSILEDKEIFAKLQYNKGFMDSDSYATYCALYDNMMQELHELYDEEILRKRQPDLMVFIHGSFEEVQRRVKRRNRAFEQTENNPELFEYYKDLYVMYEEFITNWYFTHDFPMVVVDIDTRDACNPEDVAAVMQEIEASLLESRGFIHEKGEK